MTLAEQWRAQGRLEQAPGSLLLVLEARGLSVSPDLRKRIMSIADLDTLRSWVLRAATASRIEDVFDDSPKSPRA